MATVVPAREGLARRRRGGSETRRPASHRGSRRVRYDLADPTLADALRPLASGVKKNRQDRHWAGHGPVELDDNAVDEYRRLVGR